MCLLISAAVRASTSSKSSEAFTSSPICVSVARTSSDTSDGVPIACLIGSVCVPVGFIIERQYIRRPAAPAFLVRRRQSQNSYMWQIPVALSVIQTKAHDKFIRDHKPDIIRMNIRDASLYLVQQHRNP